MVIPFVFFQKKKKKRFLRHCECVFHPSRTSYFPSGVLFDDTRATNTCCLRTKCLVQQQSARVTYANSSLARPTAMCLLWELHRQQHWRHSGVDRCAHPCFFSSFWKMHQQTADAPLAGCMYPVPCTVPVSAFVVALVLCLDHETELRHMSDSLQMKSNGLRCS